ncbi:MAG: signal peptide peptidase SppA, partial [Muribaculaceae bacterium]|nr:signal peptide peptidase SppA [Muribaculaceae bacterium]
MVLRVNSPGGSVFGSEQIGEALDYFQSKGKTLAVSMGDYAASGGYWISCHADRIFADPLTITGSIGIYGLIPNVNALSRKIGITPQTVSTNPNANFPSLFYPMTAEQHAAMQVFIEKGYDKFISRVASGRKMKKSQVMAIAEGRVWNAITAKKIGLVDQLGSMQQAIDWVAGKEEIADNYDVAVYPRSSDDFAYAMQKALEQSEAFAQFYQKVANEAPDKAIANMAINVLRRKPVQALAPRMDIRL